MKFEIKNTLLFTLACPLNKLNYKSKNEIYKLGRKLPEKN